MAESERTVSYRRKFIFFKLLSIIATIGPLLVYIVMGSFSGECGKTDKVFLSFTCLVAAMLTLINLLYKYHLRSPMFILLLGVYKTLHNILPLIIILAIGVVLDEFVFTPAYKRAKDKLVINKEIDARSWRTHFLKGRLNQY